MFSSAVFESRRGRLAEKLSDGAVLVLFAGVAPHKSRDSVYPFHANRNFYYLTGVDREHAALVAVKKGDQLDVTLYLEFVDPLEEKWTGKRLSAAEATERSGITSISDIKDLHNTLTRLLVDADHDTLYVDIEQAGWSKAPTLGHQFAKDVRDRYPSLEIRNVYPLITRLRSVKDAEEVDAIREAIRITKDGIENMMAHSHGAVKEYELEAHFNYSLKSQGVKEHAFGSIIAGGERATVLHYEDNDQVVENDQLVLCDLGAAYSHYSADITRTFPVNGRFTERQKELYEIVLLAMDETIAAIRPGLTYQELNDVTKATFARELKRIGLIQQDDEVSKYYYHGVSHPLGLDTHDVGSRSWPIEVGAVLTIEPGLYVAEEGIGIRIEDDILVTQDGPENLAKDIIKRVDEIEAFMAKHR